MLSESPILNPDEHPPKDTVVQDSYRFSNASDYLYEVSALGGRYLVIHSIET